MQNSKKTVLLVAFYNVKALGVRYLETALGKHGYHVVTVFYKTFNSVRPRPTTEEELELLCRKIAGCTPVLVGLSVMSSMYLDTVNRVLHAVKGNFTIPVVCGGAFASMFPERMLATGADYVIRTDGEGPICKLAEAVCYNLNTGGIPSLCYRNEMGEVVCNPVGDVLTELDGYGIPAIHCEDACFIENNTVREGDPQLSALSYEVIASRGCPFSCSYCCCSNLRRLLPQGQRRVRTRSVSSVIKELEEAKKQLKKLVFIHFYDEIFPNLPGWVDAFVREYRERINLPFTIWSHPNMTDAKDLKKLVSAGLNEVIMGIQSGSAYIRREVFHRNESNEEILKAVTDIQNAGVFWASYDFMLCHPFETTETLQETFNLVKQFPGRFELQLHGLNFLPGTDIVSMAVEQGYLSQDEMDAVMYAPMEEQFSAYWMRENQAESRLWYRLIYCLQFPVLKARAEKMANAPLRYEKQIDRLYQTGLRLAKLRYLYKKAHTVIKSRQLYLIDSEKETLES